MELYGRPTSEAFARMGSRSQAASVESSVRSDGPDAGMRRIRIVNGLLDIELLPDRGLDIGQVRVGGVPLAWISPTGFARAESAGADGRGWLRAFGGGLLTTCGLFNVGPPSEDDGESHTMHGRYSSLGAQITRTEVTDSDVVVEGIVHEATVLGAHLEVRRSIRTEVGSTSVALADEIVNRGDEPVEPMVLYHLNLGWPLIDEGTTLQSPAGEVRPRDADAEAGLASWSTFPAPSTPYPEQVFEHVVPRAQPAEVEVRNRGGLGVRIGFDTAVLPALFQWRVAAPAHYVLGVEPATTPTIRGRADARRRGLLRPLEPGGSLHLGVSIQIDPPPAAWA